LTTDRATGLTYAAAGVDIDAGADPSEAAMMVGVPFGGSASHAIVLLETEMQFADPAPTGWTDPGYG
jgi:hypothetical protein